MIQSTTFAALSIAAVAIAAVSYAETEAVTRAQLPARAPAVVRAHGASIDGSGSTTPGGLEPYGSVSAAFVANTVLSQATLSQATTFDAEPPPFAAKKPKINVEEVQFKTRDKLTLTADFYPSRKKGRAPAAILIHDAGQDRSGLQQVALNLQKRNFAVLALDLRGHGASISEGWDWSKRTEADRIKLWAFALRDLETATEFLRDRKDVHNANFSLVGVGAGAALAARHALHDESVRGVVLVDPQIESFGYNLYKDVVGLEGLPTLIMIPSKRRDEADRLQKQAHKQNDGLEYVKIKTVKPDKNGNPLADKRVSSETRSFLQKEAMPKR